jgi:hypothetical protein
MAYVQKWTGRGRAQGSDGSIGEGEEDVPIQRSGRTIGVFGWSASYDGSSIPVFKNKIAPSQFLGVG